MEEIQPIVRNVKYIKQEDDTFNVVIDWGKPASQVEGDVELLLNVDSYVVNEVLYDGDNAESASGQYTVVGMPAAKAFNLNLSLSGAVSGEYQQVHYSPVLPTEITFEWDEARRKVTAIPISPNVSKFKMELGYVGGNRISLINDSTSISGSDLEHGAGEKLYATAIPIVGNHLYTDDEAYASTLIPNPILGLVKPPCDSNEEDKYIVDIVEKKSGTRDCTTRWTAGERVMSFGSCYGSLTYTVDPEGSLDQGVVKYEFNSVAEFNNATSHTNSNQAVLYTVGTEKVATKRMVGVEIGKNITSLPQSFMSYCTNFNSPITIPKTVKQVNRGFLSGCINFNKPIVLPSECNFTGEGFLSGCINFNSPITLPQTITTPSTLFGYWFLNNCYAFNQPVTLPSNILGINYYFMQSCRAFNSALNIPDSVTRVKAGFMYGCWAFNQPLPFTKNLVSIENSGAAYGFLGHCQAFNQPLNFDNLETTTDRLFDSLDSYNQPISLPKLTSAIPILISNMKVFNSPVSLPVLEKACTLFSELPVFNQDVNLPAFKEMARNLNATTSSHLVYKCPAFTSRIYIPNLDTFYTPTSSANRIDIGYYILYAPGPVNVPSEIVMSGNLNDSNFNTDIIVRFCEVSFANSAVNTGTQTTTVTTTVSSYVKSVFPNLTTSTSYRNLA